MNTKWNAFSTRKECEFALMQLIELKQDREGGRMLVSACDVSLSV